MQRSRGGASPDQSSSWIFGAGTPELNWGHPGGQAGALPDALSWHPFARLQSSMPRLPTTLELPLPGRGLDCYERSNPAGASSPRVRPGAACASRQVGTLRREPYSSHPPCAVLRRSVGPARCHQREPLGVRIGYEYRPRYHPDSNTRLCGGGCFLVAPTRHRHRRTPDSGTGSRSSAGVRPCDREAQPRALLRQAAASSSRNPS